MRYLLVASHILSTTPNPAATVDVAGIVTLLVPLVGHSGIVRSIPSVRPTPFTLCHTLLYAIMILHHYYYNSHELLNPTVCCRSPLSV
jgi:hypothetical protein